MAIRREDVGEVSAFPEIAVDNHRQSGIFMSVSLCPFIQLKGLILAQNERWRRGLGMQVERESTLRGAIKVAKG